MNQLIQSTVSKLHLVEVWTIWDELGQKIKPEEEFVISLDGDFLVRDPDASIEMTRAVSTVADAEAGRFERIPRLSAPQLYTQARRIQRALNESGKETVTLFDDGVGSGRTIQKIVQLLYEHHVKVDRIVTVANPNGPRSIEGVAVETLLEIDSDFIWLNERDLFWGAARSGISIASNRVSGGPATSGIPYSFTERLIENRIGIKSTYIPEFRTKCLELNWEFWKVVDKKHSCLFPFARCPRLRSFAELIELDIEESVSRFLESMVTKLK